MVPYLGGWTSIYHLFCSLGYHGFDPLPYYNCSQFLPFGEDQKPPPWMLMKVSSGRRRCRRRESLKTRQRDQAKRPSLPRRRRQGSCRFGSFLAGVWIIFCHFLVISIHFEHKMGNSFYTRWRVQKGKKRENVVFTIGYTTKSGSHQQK